MTNTMTFADLLAAANETKTGRSPGQWTPAACRVWREAEPEAAPARCTEEEETRELRQQIQIPIMPKIRIVVVFGSETVTALRSNRLTKPLPCRPRSANGSEMASP